MKTAFATQPGFFAANSNKVEKDLPDGIMRIYCLRLEAYDLSNSQIDLDTSFKVFAALADGNPRVAKALLMLGAAIEKNRAMIEEEAKK